MTNPFSGIITTNLKNLFKNAIDSLLESGVCGRTCRIYYGVTKYESCDACSANPVGKKSSNSYLAGGYAPVGNTNQCPVCHGTGKRPVETTEDVTLCVIYDYKKFIPISTVVTPGNESYAQTICPIALLPKLKNANYIIFNTNILPYAEHKFQRLSEPEPLGFGSDDYIAILWKRI